VNYYEREIEVMKKNFEKDKKEMEQAHQLEVSMLEDQKADMEALYAKSQEVILGLQEQLQDAQRNPEPVQAGLAHCCAQALCGLARRLEEEMHLRHQNQLQQIRIEYLRLSEENSQLKSDLERTQLELEAAENRNNTQRKEIKALKKDKEKACCELEELNTQTEKYKNELSQLNCKVLQLEEDISVHQTQKEENQASFQLVMQRLAEAGGREEQQGDQIQKLTVELAHVNEECQRLRLSQSELTESLEESRDQLRGVHLRLEAAQAQHGQTMQHLQEQMAQLVPGARVAELQRLLSLQEEETARQLHTQE
uniref:Ninein n=1 Tax=Jaculus jaculus TaxID=51337 RepID=A0A8C5K7A8_JACJA